MLQLARLSVQSARAILTRRLFSYAGLTVAAQIIQMVASIVVLRWLQPAEVGIWGSLLIVESYASILRMGVINGMNRRYPLFLGRGEKAKAQGYVAVTLLYTLVIAGVLAVGGVLAAVLAQGMSWVWRVGVLALAVYIPASLYGGFVEATAKGSQNFALIARIGLTRSIFGAVSVPLVIVYGYEGFCARIVLMAAFSVLILHRFRPVVVAPRLDWLALRELLRDGFPLFLSNFGMRVVQSVGSIMLLALGGTFAVGMFSPVAAVLALVASIPDAISSYWVPQQHFTYGSTGTHKSVIQKVVSSTVALFLVSLLVALVAVGAVGPSLRLLLPNYSAAERAIQVALLLGCVRILSIASTAFVTLGVWKVLLTNQAVFYVLHAALVVLGALVYHDRPWLGVVLGMLVAHSFNAVQSLYRLRKLSMLERIV